MPTRFLLCIVMAILAGGASLATADGCFVPRITSTSSTSIVASPRQEAVLVTNGKRVQVVLRTHFRAGPKELAWIVPVPGKPGEIARSDAEIFETLESATAPRFHRRTSKRGLSFGCGSMGASQDLNSGVVVEATGTAGIFKYHVLSATDGGALARWLDDNDYKAPVRAERVFARYVRAGWYWLAMQVRPEVSDSPTLAPHPITYTYTSERLVYPMVISRLSADAENEIVLYVIASTRYVCTNWTNLTIDHEDIRADAHAPSGTNYEQLLRSATVRSSGQLFVTEYARARNYTRHFLEGPGGLQAKLNDKAGAGVSGGSYVTRLRAIMTPMAMDRDVALVGVLGWPEVGNDVTLSGGPDLQRSSAHAGVACAAILMLVVSAGVITRPGAAGVIGKLLVLCACVTFAAL